MSITLYWKERLLGVKLLQINLYKYDFIVEIVMGDLTQGVQITYIEVQYIKEMPIFNSSGTMPTRLKCYVYILLHCLTRCFKTV